MTFMSKGRVGVAKRASIYCRHDGKYSHLSDVCMITCNTLSKDKLTKKGIDKRSVFLGDPCKTEENYEIQGRL